MKSLKSFYWFTLSTLLAGISVGQTTKSISWGVTTCLVLNAVRNCVMAGYVEGRVRYNVLKSERNG